MEQTPCWAYVCKGIYFKLCKKKTKTIPHIFMTSSCQVLVIILRSVEDCAAVLLQNTQTKQHQSSAHTHSQTLTPNWDI